MSRTPCSRAPARQQGLDDQYPDRRQDQPAPELLTILELRVVHLAKLSLIHRFRRMLRQTTAKLLQGFVLERGRLAFQRVEIDRKRSRPICRVDRVQARFSGVAEKRTAPS